MVRVPDDLVRLASTAVSRIVFLSGIRVSGVLAVSIH